MIIADTNIISTFARVGALDYVRQLVRVDRLYVTPATFNELRRAVEAGCDFLAPTLATIQAARNWISWSCGEQKSWRRKTCPLRWVRERPNRLPSA